MTVRLSRRDTLLRTAAVAAAGLIPGAAIPGLAAPLRTSPRSGEIDAILQARVDAADVPGVVAMAATEHSVIYQGAFGARSMGTAARMSADTVFSIASMTKLLTSVAAMQLVERDKLKLDEPAARIDPTLGSPQVLDGFDAKGAPQLRAARKPVTLRNLLTHTSGLSYQLWDTNVVRYGKASRNDPALPRTPLIFRSGHQVGLWRQSRPGRPARRNHQWAKSGSLFPRSHPGSARDERHRLLAYREAARPPGQSAFAQGGWYACAAAFGETNRTESDFRWRRHLFHSAGLSDFASGAAEWRSACRERASCGRRRLR